MEACNEPQLFKRKSTACVVGQLPKKRKIQTSGGPQCIRAKLSAWKDSKRVEENEVQWPAIFNHEGPPVVIQASVPSTPSKCSVLDLSSNCEKSENSSEVRRLKDTIEDLECQVETLKLAIQSAEVCRKALHCQIVKLKGPVKVMCRVKPNTSGRRLPISYPEMDFADVAEGVHSLAINFDYGRLDFTCDRIFTETSRQEDFFSEVSSYLERVLEGEPLTIFLYGASGSGKTYTLEGPTLETELTHESGLIPRTAYWLLSRVSPSVNVKMSFLYIANDTLQDLILPQSQKMTIKTGEWGVGADLLSWHIIGSPENAIELTRLANERRSNDVRGHTLYQFLLEGSDGFLSRLTFVELAGAEAHATSVSEGKFLNVTFSCLRRVVSAKMGPQKSGGLLPPYRDCKLTRVLQDSLTSDQAKILFCLTISSTEETAVLTRETLKYGAALQSCVV